MKPLINSLIINFFSFITEPLYKKFAQLAYYMYNCSTAYYNICRTWMKKETKGEKELLIMRNTTMHGPELIAFCRNDMHEAEIA